MVASELSAPRGAGKASSLKIPLAFFFLLIGWSRILGAQGSGSITGTVRDTAGAALAGAEVILDTTRVTTNPQGSFRFDNLRAGQHLITIRLVGFSPLRARVMVQSDITHQDFVLQPSIPTLPTVTVEARRSGIYGTVGDSAFAPIPGVTVLIGGSRGGTVVTDPGGRFALGVPNLGQYMIRIAHPGYREERLFVELKKGEGVELAIRLRPSKWKASRIDDIATQDLGRRLALNMPAERLGASALTRFGSLGLCEVNQIGGPISKIIGRWPPPQADTGLTIIVNGTLVLERMSVRALCSWRADEVQLVEFMPDVCRDLTRTLVYLLNVWCTDLTGQGRPSRLPGSNPAIEIMREREALRQGGRISGQRLGGPVVVIWERS